MREEKMFRWSSENTLKFLEEKYEGYEEITNLLYGIQTKVVEENLNQPSKALWL